jgi:hypothetical protein
MILRLSQKLSTKIKAGTLKAMPLDENPYADWTCHLFAVDRTQYILVSNTNHSTHACCTARELPTTIPSSNAC